MSGFWLCSTTEGVTCHLDQASAEAGVALGSTGIPLSPQNAAQGVARVVERAMGHLGLRTGEIA